MRTVLWTLERAKSMIKSNAVTAIEIIPNDSQNRFKIRFSCKYNAQAFLCTSYSNTEKNKERTFADIGRAAKTVGKLYAS